ncbi:hypothetical protein DYB34_006608, partial [Aphanomyces astaci]
YAIDCLIRSHEIPTLVRGVHCLIQDVHAVRSQKQSSLARQRSSQANQQSIQATLDDTSRMYHNLLRVLQRAEDENVIAKPEAGGTVRLIPATAQGMRLLRDKINALHQEEEQESEALADSKRLTAINSTEARVHKITVELERVDTLTTPYIDTDVYIAGTLQRVERHILTSNLQAERIKLQQQLEMLQAQAATAKVHRTNLRAQGIELTDALVSLLQADTMLADVLAMDGPSTSSSLSSPLAFEVGISILHTLFCLCIEEEIPAYFISRTDDTSKLNALEPSIFVASSVDASTTIRRKGVHERSLDEKKWVALDRLLSPALYLTLSEPDIQEMRLNAHYNTSLTAAQISRLLQLPERANLALPFLKSTDEVQAHKLLRHYTKGDGESFFNALDVQFAPPRELIQDLDTAIHKQMGAALRLKPIEACSPDERAWRDCDRVLQEDKEGGAGDRVVASLPLGLTSIRELKQLTTLSQSDHPAWKVLHLYGSLMPPRVVVVHTLADIVDSNQQSKLMELTDCRLRARQSATHEFQLHTTALHLTVSIVFEGTYSPPLALKP